MTYVLGGVLVVLSIEFLFHLLTVVSKRLNRRGSAEVADNIERHILGTEGPWDWDDFTSVPIADDRLDVIRLRCLELEQTSAEERTEELKRIVDRLRSERA